MEEVLRPGLAAHVRGCESCQAALERARRFGGDLRVAAASIASPDMPNLRLTLQAEAGRSMRPSLFATFATVAGAIVIVALLLTAYRAASLPIGVDTPTASALRSPDATRGLPSATTTPSSEPTPSSDPSPDSDPSPSSATTPGTTPTARESASAVAGATPMPVDGPPEVRNRTPLPSCGHEVVERIEFVDHYDAQVRECFLTAYNAGEPAEFVTDALTVEGGRSRAIYRYLSSGAIEIFVDSTGDPLATPGWVRVLCRSIRVVHEDPAGVPFFVGDECDEPVALEG